MLSFNVAEEKPDGEEDAAAADGNKETPATEAKEKEPEDKGSDKGRHKDAIEKEARKALSINEFLKPAEGEKYYNPGGRGGRGSSKGGGYGGNAYGNVSAPSIEDPG
ncbi:hypothetical protein MtrunA17_Chr8g0336041 [Medicago truncatula]|uniref:Uncharacterized protein n=1 Tax=Medicago truncatula TaxID=3880 RepID=A0A396GAC2_MEDTR|nr:hypothetical protein MtrunA17_Chr8g0336041 [Medicago truncatula]